VGHHRFSIVLDVKGELAEPTKNKTVPSDDAIAAKVAARLNGFDVGEGYVVTGGTVTVKEKKKKD
jgi:DUF1009 family protein